MSEIPWFSAADIAEILPRWDAASLLDAVLHDGLDPADDPVRSVLDVQYGQLLMMPAETSNFVGVKMATVAPGNPAIDRPRIHAVYVLFDALTLAPIAFLDGIALTSLRTPAMSALALRYLGPAVGSRLIVFGAGPQALGHIEALQHDRAITEVTIVSRDPERARRLATRIGGRIGTPGEVALADIVVCASSAVEPLFDGRLVPDHACVVAIGSHQPDVRELDTGLMRRAQVVVEDRATALREAGDVVLAELGAEQLIPFTDIRSGRVKVKGTRPRVFKGVGMAWQDLAVATEIVARGAP